MIADAREKKKKKKKKIWANTFGARLEAQTTFGKGVLSAAQIPFALFIKAASDLPLETPPPKKHD